MQLETRQFIPGTEIQIVEPPVTGKIRFMVADFDGTLSLIRDGWQDVMVPQHVEALVQTPAEEERIQQLGEETVRSELETLARDYIDRLTGKQTIYQMFELAEQIRRRGGKPADPQEYKDVYHERLLKQIEYRRHGLETGVYSADDWIVPRGRMFVEGIAGSDVECYLASGTDEEFVMAEVTLLGLMPFFEGRVHGAIRDYQNFSKEMVIRRILEENQLSGDELLIIGDGVVEIGIGREVGAVVVGVNTVENNRYGMNANKRDRLIDAGAQLLIPDFRDYQAMLDYLLA